MKVLVGLLWWVMWGLVRVVVGEGFVKWVEVGRVVVGLWGRGVVVEMRGWGVEMWVWWWRRGVVSGVVAATIGGGGGGGGGRRAVVVVVGGHGEGILAAQ